LNSGSLSQPFLLARGVTKTYVHRGWSHRGRHKALDQVDMALPFAKTVALVGESGSGKTTLAMCLAGLECPDAGEIWMEGRDLVSAGKRQLAAIRPQLQMLWQDSAAALSPVLTASEIVEEPLLAQLRASPRQRSEIVSDLFQKVGLRLEWRIRYPHQLSGGQRQRLAIARALASQPRLLVLDEPFTGLDLSVRGQIINLLLDLQATHALTYLYVSHDLEVVRYFADEVAVMHRGRIVEQAPTAELFVRPSHLYTKKLLSAIPAFAGIQGCAN